MKKDNIRITIDPNGQVRREILEDPPGVEIKSPSLLKRILSAISIRSITQG